MSRPRKPYGPNSPGRLPATMIKVLAAELSDQGRLSRGKRYWADHAVTDIVIGHGSVTAQIQGSRATPYVVTIEAKAGAGVPTKRDVWVRCTCPDDSGNGSGACKHAVAALFAMSDEVALEPELIDRWRRSSNTFPIRTADGTADETDVETDDQAAEAPERMRNRRGEADVLEFRPRRDPIVDELSLLLQPPAGGGPPDIPDPEPISHGSIRDHLLAEILTDALEVLANRWQ
jgi:hypothetical protein